jgi:hypothetical protein
MRLIAAITFLLVLLLMGQPAAAQTTATIIYFSCDGSQADLLGKIPVKKMGLVVDLAEHTVTMSGLGFTAHIDRVDAAAISFSAEKVPTSSSALGLRTNAMESVWGEIDRVTGAVSATTTSEIAKQTTMKSYDLVCKVTNRLF